MLEGEKDLSVDDKLEILRIYAGVLEGAIVATMALVLDSLDVEVLTDEARASGIAFVREALHNMVDADEMVERLGKRMAERRERLDEATNGSR